MDALFQLNEKKKGKQKNHTRKRIENPPAAALISAPALVAASSEQQVEFLSGSDDNKQPLTPLLRAAASEMLLSIGLLTLPH